MTADDTALAKAAKAFRLELKDWLGAQEISDPMDMQRPGESMNDRMIRTKRVLDEPMQAYRAHDADFKDSYSKRFTERALRIYDAFEARGIKPAQSREKYELGWMTLIVESIIEDVGRMCAELEAKG